MTDSETKPLRMFDPIFPAEAIEQDRVAISEFLDRYLATGKLPAVPKLATGTINLQGRREPIGQCAERWSEVRGKYAGNMFWSVEAANTFDHVAEKNPGKTSETIGRMAASKRLNDHQLQHESVFPRKAWQEMMSPHLGGWEAGNAEELAARMDEFCFACIVTRKEFLELGGDGVTSNPWMRYRRTSIRIKDNPGWSEQHRTWIGEAKLTD